MKTMLNRCNPHSNFVSVKFVDKQASKKYFVPSIILMNLITVTFIPFDLTLSYMVEYCHLAFIKSIRANILGILSVTTYLRRYGSKFSL